MRRRAEWRRLAAALERSGHATAERRALRDDSPWRRVLAARRLALLPSPASRRALRRALVRGPEPVVDAAARALARDGDRAALRWILRHPGSLAHRTHPALVTLMASFGAPATGDLVAALEGDPDPRFARALIEALGLRGHGPARPAIERRLRATELELRVASARALGRLRAVESAHELLAALGDEAWQVRAQAALALGRLHAPGAVDALVERLGDPSWWVRRHAASALVELGEPGRSALEAIAGTSRDPYARDIARETLNLAPESRSA